MVTALTHQEGLGPGPRNSVNRVLLCFLRWERRTRDSSIRPSSKVLGSSSLVNSATLGNAIGTSLGVARETWLLRCEFEKELAEWLPRRSGLCAQEVGERHHGIRKFPSAALAQPWCLLQVILLASSHLRA